MLSLPSHLDDKSHFSPLPPEVHLNRRADEAIWGYECVASMQLFASGFSRTLLQMFHLLHACRIDLRQTS